MARRSSCWRSRWRGGGSWWRRWGGAVAVESLVYVALFVALSARFGRALILGAGYVFIWEAIVAEFAPGAQYLSVRESTLGIADAIADVAPALFEARLGLA